MWQRAHWLTVVLLGLFVSVAMSCASTPDVEVKTTSQALEQGACGSNWIYSWSSAWTPGWGRTEAIVPSGVFMGSGTTAQITFTDGQTSTSCNYTNGVFVSCSSGAFNGSRLFATSVAITSNGSAWVEISFTANDGNSCKSDTCSNNTPTHQNLTDGTVCDTSDACKTSLTCQSGACTGGGQTLTPNDGNSCTTDHCDSSRGMWSEWDTQNCGSAPTAPPLADPTISTATDFWNNVSFLYTGTETIDPNRASVIRGRIVTASGSSLPNVAVTVLGHNYGTVYSDAAGFFSIVVNGGADVVLNFVGPAGYLRSQRRATARSHDYTTLDDLILLADMNQGAKQTLTRGTAGWGHGATENEGGISRTARVFFPTGWDVDTTKSQWTPGGSTLTFGTVEYTANGPAAMPGNLPAMSRYTYATRFAFDEAVNVPNVYFDTSHLPVMYVEPLFAANDPNNAPGKEVPAGSYDLSRGVWVPEATGTIIKITAHGGGVVTLDLGGQSEGSLGITTEEKQQLAIMYANDGVLLWRVRAAHFSDYDFNWAFGMPVDPAQPPNEPPAPTKPMDDKTCSAGSIIECENQILGERLAVPGTPYTLSYQSDRQAGFYPGFTLRLTPSANYCGGMLPACPVRIEMHVEVMGQKTVFTPPNVLPNIIGTFTWDRKDAYSRIVQGAALAHIEMRWIYTAVTKSTPGFGAPPKNVSGGSREKSELYISRFFEIQLGAFDAKALGFGGLTLSPHHVYDPGTVTVFRGDGGRESGSKIVSAAWTAMGGGSGGTDDGFPAAGASLGQFEGFTVGGDGAVYSGEKGLLSACRIRRKRGCDEREGERSGALLVGRSVFASHRPERHEGWWCRPR